MMLICDSGATKIHWYFRAGSCVPGHGEGPEGDLVVSTEGINAATSHEADIRRKVAVAAEKAGKERAGKVSRIFFYGAGLVSEDASSPLRRALAEEFPNASRIEFASDLTGAARALFGRGRGVAAIIGTGSNSGLCDNGQIVKNIRPGGFILGDEGSGAALGKMLLADYFKELVPEEFARMLDREFSLSYPEAVARIYKGEAPSRYLASFAKFIVEHKDNEYAATLIERNLRSFIERSLCRYGCEEIGVVGSLGYACRDELTRLGAGYGLDFVTFLPSPVEALAKYHDLI